MKNKRSFMQELYIVFIVLLLLTGIFFATYSTFLFFNGFHNVDLAYNSCLVSNDIDVDFRQARDFYNPGESVSTFDLYLIGLRDMKHSAIGMMGGGFLIGFAIMLLVWEKKEEE